MLLDRQLLVLGAFFDTVPSSTCQNPCSTLTLDFGLPVTSSSGEGERRWLKLYFKGTLKVRKTTLAYDETTLVAEVGGYLGLCLGVSLLDLTVFVKWIRRVWQKKV